MGSVFKLEYPDGYFYIGSTTKTLEEAFKKIRYENHYNTTNPKFQHHNGWGWDEVKMVLIEKVDTDLLKKRDEYIAKEIDNPKCVSDKRKVKKSTTEQPVLTEEQMAKNKAKAEKCKATKDRKKAELEEYSKKVEEQKTMEAIHDAVYRTRRQKEIEEGYALEYEERAKNHRTQALKERKAYHEEEATYWEEKAQTTRKKAEQDRQDAQARYDEWRKENGK